MPRSPSIEEILSSDKLTLDVARKIILAQQSQITELKALVEKFAGKNPTRRVEESYSLSAEAKRKTRQHGDADKKKKKAKRKNKNARMKTADKVKLAAHTESAYPQDRSPADCQFSHDRVAWRIKDGRAVLVAYKIYRFRNEFGRPSGLVGRGEFGIEIMVSLAYQVYVVGISIDKACLLLHFFEQLKLRKS